MITPTQALIGLFAAYATFGLFLGALWLRAWWLRRRLIQLRLAYYGRKDVQPSLWHSDRRAAGRAPARNVAFRKEPHLVFFQASA